MALNLAAAVQQQIVARATGLHVVSNGAVALRPLVLLESGKLLRMDVDVPENDAIVSPEPDNILRDISLICGALKV